MAKVALVLFCIALVVLHVQAGLADVNSNIKSMGEEAQKTMTAAATTVMEVGSNIMSEFQKMKDSCKSPTSGECKTAMGKMSGVVVDGAMKFYDVGMGAYSAMSKFTS